MIQGGENIKYDSSIFIDYKTGKLYTSKELKNHIRKQKLKKINDIRYN